jgi:hypothetical protein
VKQVEMALATTDALSGGRLLTGRSLSIRGLLFASSEAVLWELETSLIFKL